ncbi:MAG: NAD-dependent deacylase [Burkholderiales bacterium]|jgi:NAD-dependent deacetylase|nr:NAD-dependent deacylase [Burkholderiales bacterium]
MTEAAIAAAARRLARAHRVAVLTGAGISAESGVPTFRDTQRGLWAQFDPMQLASREGFAADPALVWRWYAWRRELVAGAQPNAGHLALAPAAARFAQFDLITQNVDGLHARAGSRNVLELHGNLLRSKCFAQCGTFVAEPRQLPPGEPPRCPRCGNWLRPDVVWFGEMLDPDVLDAAQQAAVDCDAMLVVGTSGLVTPAAGLPAAAKRAGATVVVVNPNESELDDVADHLIRGPAAAVLPSLFPS